MKKMEEAKKQAKSNSFFSFLDQFSGNKKDEDEGSIEFSLAGLFKCMLCTHPKSNDEKQQLVRIADSLTGLQKKVDSIERYVIFEVLELELGKKFVFIVDGTFLSSL